MRERSVPAHSLHRPPRRGGGAGQGPATRGVCDEAKTPSEAAEHDPRPVGRAPGSDSFSTGNHPRSHRCIMAQGRGIGICIMKALRRGRGGIKPATRADAVRFLEGAGMGEKPRVVITRRLPGVSLAKIGEKAEAVLPDRDGPMPRKELLRKVRGASGILSTLADRIDALLTYTTRKALRVVSNFAVGVNNIDVAEATRRS